jgi:hypothetical protein
MSFISRHSRILIVAVSCAVIGAGAGAIATAGASTSPVKATGAHAGRARRLRAWERQAVQGSVMIATKQGFKTVSFERGTVQSVSGQQLTLAEGSRKATYKTVTLTIPAGALVRDNGRKSTLSSVTDGQRAVVVGGPKNTFVFAHTPRTA